MPRPLPKFQTYYGQREIIPGILTLIRGAKRRAQPLIHLLLLGTSGLGKTSLARAIADEYGTNCHTVVATPWLRASAWKGLAEQWKACDIVFIDEIHSLNIDAQEALFKIMADSTLGPTPATENGIVRVGDSFPEVTVIGATDRPGLLLNPLKTRFRHHYTLCEYVLEEMIQIVKIRADECDIVLTAQAARLVAETCNGIPRVAGARLEMLAQYVSGRDATTDPAEQEFETVAVGAEQVHEFLTEFRIDPNGLSSAARAYLLLLAGRHGLGARLQELAATLRLDKNYIQRDIEPGLLRLGLIRIPDKRFITDAGIQYVEEHTHEVESGQCVGTDDPAGDPIG